jgi:dienelactone hydrolase
MLGQNAPIPIIIVLLLILSLIIVGCSSSAPSAETPQASDQPEATTVAAQPTVTASPAASSTPSAVPTADTWRYEETLKLFDYDQGAPLDLQEVGKEEKQDITIHDISYASPKGGRVTGYLIVPQGPGPFAGVIVQHGSPGSRDSLRGYAEELVKTGAVALLIDAPFTRRDGRFMAFGQRDYDEQIQFMVDLRRGVDLLQSRPDVDPERIGYVGYSYGAALGGLLAGIEKRIKAFVFAVGDGGLVEHYSNPTPANDVSDEVPPDVFERWKALMDPIEPMRFVAHAAPSALLYQNARNDSLVNSESAKRYQEAGSQPKEIIWYNTGHGLGSEVFRDQIDWLSKYIGIDPQKYKW